MGSTLAVLLAGATVAVAATDPAVLCNARKISAAGKASQGWSKCQSEARKKGIKIDPLCLQKVSGKLAASFTKIEGSVACATVDNLGLIAWEVQHLGDILDAILTLPTTPVTPCGDTAAGACDGACPAGEACYAAWDGETTSCRCVPRACGSFRGAEQCWGECPAGEACTSTPTGCTCQPSPTPCGSAAVQQCDGTCPAGQACLPQGDALSEIIVSCACYTMQCGTIHGAPLCSGECPGDAPYCRDVNGTCVCSPSLN